MEKTADQYYAEWRSRNWTRPAVGWKGTYLENGYCSECRLCCGPQVGDPPFPMALLPGQLHPGIEDVFYMYDATHAELGERGCRALGEHGCRVQRSERPPACGIFPIMVVRMHLYLYTVCPAALFVPYVTWTDLGTHARTWLRTFSEEDQRQISMDIPDSVLQDHFLNLHIAL